MKVRLRALTAAVAVLVAFGLTGCGTTDTAAVVDGVKISDSDARLAAEQISTQFAQQLNNQPLATADAVRLLVLAHAAIPWADKLGNPLTADAARTRFTKVPDPSPAAIEVLRANNALSGYQTATPEDQQALVSAISALKVTLNPRYGTFDVAQGTMKAATPNWLVPSAAAK